MSIPTKERCMELDRARLIELTNLILKRLHEEDTTLFTILVGVMEVKREFYDSENKEKAYRILINAASESDDPKVVMEAMRLINDETSRILVEGELEMVAKIGHTKMDDVQ